MIRIRSTLFSVNRLPQKLLLAGVMGLAIAPLVNAPAAMAQATLKRATITNLRNRVQLKPKKSQLRKAQPRDVLIPGDQLATGRASFAEFSFNEGTLARMGERAIFRFIPRSRNFILQRGTVLLLIPPGKGSTKVRTPNVLTGIRGSALFIRHDEERNQTIVGALTDSGIEVSDLDGSSKQVLKAGQMAVAVDGTIQGLYDFDLAKFFETSPLSEGILDGTVGAAEVLQEIQEGLEAQGDFATASASEGIMQTPSFIKLSTAEDSETGLGEVSVSGVDALEDNVVESITAQDNSTFPGQALGILVESETSTAVSPVVQPEPAQPGLEVPKLEGLEPQSPPIPAILPEPAGPETKLPELPLLPEPPALPEPSVSVPPELPEVQIPAVPIPDMPTEPSLPELNTPEPSLPDIGVTPELPTGSELPQTGDEDGAGTTVPELMPPELTLPQIPDDDFPGRGNGVHGDFPGQGKGVEDGFPGRSLDAQQLVVPPTPAIL